MDSGLIYEAGIQESAIPRTDGQEETETAEEDGEAEDTPAEESVDTEGDVGSSVDSNWEPPGSE